MPFNEKEKSLSVMLVVCEKVLVELDAVASLIRMADIFQFIRDPAKPNETPVVAIWSFLAIRYAPGTGLGDHTLELRLVRPDGEVKTVAPPAQTLTLVPGAIPDAMGGFNIPASFGVIAKQTGFHHLIALLDGEEIAKSTFLLRELSPLPEKPN
jgi:hypothetical protein